MQTSECSVASDPHVVDWQIVRNTDNNQHDWNVHGLRERIQMLEGQAITLSRLVVRTNPKFSAARESLAALDRQIASLRADLAWGRAEQPA
jgi:uncharacterized protein involved in exopolysaccharide biosynthesis